MQKKILTVFPAWLLVALAIALCYWVYLLIMQDGKSRGQAPIRVPANDTPLVNDPQVSFSGQQGTSRNLSLDANIKRFADYLRQNNQIAGYVQQNGQVTPFSDYTLVMPPAAKADASKVNIGNQSYDVAFVGSHSLFTFHSADGGLTWMPLPPTDPYIRKLSEDYGKTGKRGADLIRQVDADMNPMSENAAVTVALEHCDWGTPPLKTSSTRRNEKPKLHWWIKKELQDNPALAGTLEGVAQAVQRQASGVAVTIYDCAKRGDNLWVAGEVCSGSGKMKSGDDHATPRGFICHSSDGGKSWGRQWLSDNTQPEPVYGIYFSDTDEGWGLTIQRVLHTKNGGNSWEQVFRCDEWCGVENLFILGKTDLIVATRWGSGHLLYSSRDRGVSWEKASKPVARNDSELADLQKSFGSAVHFHYGGVYSREGQDK